MFLDSSEDTIMAGSIKSAILHVIAGIMLFAQAAVSAAVLDDTPGAILAGGFGILMFIGAQAARVGGLAQVFDVGPKQDYGPYTTVQRWTDTGQRIQCTPLFGCCGGIFVLAVVLIVGAPLFESAEGIVLLLPGILGGVFALLAAAMFIIDYKGPWMDQAF
ncbi:MAG: hypothetical protein EAX95_12050 [Candidatus Thorarchaeota archaeon]|nr:hypothetical protein [Candidatus Thorarchaeota archaeon]